MSSITKNMQPVLSMTRRKPHHKSRLGCSNCKRRRIKCDEFGPCSNCIRRKEECSLKVLRPSPPWEKTSSIHVFHQYPEFIQDSISQPPPMLALADETIFGLLQNTPDALKLPIRRILHHFASTTSKTLAPTERLWMDWPSFFPKLVLQNPYVLEGIVSLTALHLSRVLPSAREKKFHSMVAMRRLNTGLAHYRNALCQISNQNAEALFTFSVAATLNILIIGSMECRSLLSRRNDSDAQLHAITKDLTATIIRILQGIRGVRIILAPSWSSLEHGILSVLVTRKWWPPAVATDSRAIEEGHKIQDLEKMWIRPGRGYEYYFDDLAAALAQLRVDFARLSQLTIDIPATDINRAGYAIIDSTAVMAWPANLDRKFINLLEERRPEAWLILAHYAILPHRVYQVNQVWWLEGLSTNILATASLVLSKRDLHWLEWPLHETGLDIESIRPTPGP
ncbi:hypothetical protein B0J11DRAFT_270221 [Dendryphion nanum]|uniref:Zn(2)-C6 fungal-type domain-containing protein n=1 Tax=Dendryphion nanum TaxID=256645 RepID=A0A9P9E0B7_9PLEO|nr:hypothetical protein B0J11DRAFT_270221 [Dendryphion nanum]